MVIRIAALAAILFGLAACPVAAQERPTLAVFETVNTPAAAKTLASVSLDLQEMTRQIEEGLRATRRFTVFERSREILANTVFSEQELVDTSRFVGDAAQFGKMNNVQFIVQPMVTSLHLSVRRVPNDEAPGRFRYLPSGAAGLTVKVLDSTTGELAYQTSQDLALPTGSPVARMLQGPDDGAAVHAEVWRWLSRQAASRVTNAVVGALFPIQVVQAQGADIFVNRGEGGGIAPGETYQLFSVGEALIDPVTREKLGQAEELLGDVEVIRVTPRFSVVRARAPLTGDAKAGDVLRPKP
jgi:hypothetical protein